MLAFKAEKCYNNDRLREISIGKQMPYQVIIHDAEEGGYWAEVAGMPGCYSEGETLAEAKANIQEAAMGWMESIVDGMKTPISECSTELVW